MAKNKGKNGGGGGPRPPYPDRKLATNDTEIKLEHKRTMDMRWRITNAIVCVVLLGLVVVLLLFVKDEKLLLHVEKLIYLLGFTVLSLCGISIKSVVEAWRGKKD